MATAQNAVSPSKHSCHRCAIRKIKCDKQRPCSGCVRQNSDCEYRVLQPPRRRKKPDRTEILSARLEQYERLLRRKGVDPDGLQRDPSRHETPSSTAKGSGLAIKDTTLLTRDPKIAQSPSQTAQSQLLHDRNRSKYLDYGLWTRVVEELGEPEDALGRSSGDEYDENDAAQDGTDFLLGPIPNSIDIHDLHPPAEQILELWHVFLENVDPLTKVIHSPSLQPAIQKAVKHAASMPKSLEALLFAIYSAAIVSLKNHECERRFGESREILLSRYRSATKAALSRVKFIGSANLAVLQAFLIHLMSMRDIYDSRALWTLTGLALRMAEGMGLHRDGSVLSLPPFETEVRRRVWWQLKIFDGDCGELSGSNKFTLSNTESRSPKLPSNINDDELYPGMTSPPTATTDRAPDMVFCAMRYDLRSYWTSNAFKERRGSMENTFWNHDRSSVAINERDKAIDEFEKMLEAKYVRYCDPSQPIQFMASITARAAVSTARLIAHHPRRWASDESIPDSERRFVWDLSMKGLKQYNMIHSSRELQRFSWHAAYYFRWQPFIHILDTLRINPLMQEAAQAWLLVDEVYETNPEFATNSKKALYVAIGNLCLKAYNAREAASSKECKSIAAPPWYIPIFSSRRETANARRKSLGRTGKDPDHSPQVLPMGTPSMTAEQQIVPPQTRIPPQKQLPPVSKLPSSLPPQPPATTASYQPESSGSRNGGTWFTSYSTAEPAEELFAFTDDNNTNTDLDMLLAPDFPMEDGMNQNIDWEKWDTLLSNFT